MKIQLIYIVEDGIASLTCGVGVVAQHFLNALPDITEQGIFSGCELTCNIVTLALPDGAPGQRPDLLHKATSLTKKYKGIVNIIPNLSTKQGDYFSFHNWQHYCNQAQEIVDGLTKNFTGPTLIIVNDGIFGKIHNPGHYSSLVWIPHSLSVSHQQSYVNQTERETWERDCVKNILEKKDSYIGVLSPYVQNLVKRHFQIPQDKIIPFNNGFYLPTLKDEFQREYSEIKRYLSSYSIPTDRPLIFSFARADEYKGLDIALNSIVDFINQQGEFHGVVLASGFSEEPVVKKVQQSLRNIAGNNQKITLLFDLDFLLPKLIIQWPHTRYLLHLPLKDFCPLVPFEAQILGHEELIILTSKIPCFEGIIDNSKGYPVEPTVKSVVEYLTDIQQIPLEDIKQINLRAKETALQEYDIVQQYRKSMTSALLPLFPLESSAGAVISRTYNRTEQILLVEHRDHTYVFPKGHIEPGEDPRQAALREIKEETGYCQVSLGKEIGVILRYSHKPDGSVVRKVITMFQGTIQKEKRSNSSEESWEWINASSVVNLLRYEEDKHFFDRLKLPLSK